MNSAFFLVLRRMRAPIIVLIVIYAIAIFGLTLVLAALPGLSLGLSVVGAAYLAWLGLQCLRSKGALPEARAEGRGGRAFVTGFFTNLLNPKAMLYFGSILSQVLTPELDLAARALVWALLVGESFLWFALVALLFSSPRVLAGLQSRLKWFERLIGVALLTLAAKVASAAWR